MPGRRAQERAVRHRALGPHLQVVFPGVGDATVDLDRVLDDTALAVTGGDLRHGGGEAPAYVVLGDGECAEVDRCSCALDREVVVRQLVLDRLETADGYAELLALLRVFDGAVENGGTSADGLRCDGDDGELDTVLDRLRLCVDTPGNCLVEVQRRPRPGAVQGRDRF